MIRKNKHFLSDKKRKKVFKAITHMYSINDLKQVSLKDKQKHYLKFLIWYFIVSLNKIIITTCFDINGM